MGLFDFLSGKKAEPQPHDAGAAGTDGGGQEQRTQFSSQGPIPAVGAAEGAAARQASASEQAFDAPQNESLTKVNAAIAANNLPLLISLQHEIRKLMLTDPLNPPKEARDALAVARKWTMEQVAGIVDSYAGQLKDASAGASKENPKTGEVQVINSLMDEECSKYLAVLMEGDPQYRYQHENTQIQDKVFTAVRLHSSQRGVGKVGHRGEAETEARADAGLPAGSWCGAFAYTQAHQAGGFDDEWKQVMHHEANIRHALDYTSMKDTWIWAFNDWKLLEDYHAERKSMRSYKTVEENPQAEAGDLCLKDNAFGNDPDHITTVTASDGNNITTVGGNEGGKELTDETGVKTSAPINLDEERAKKPTDVRKKDDKGQRIPETHDTDAKGNLLTKTKRVHGIGRWSIVDYEEHLYKKSATKPAVPKPKELEKLG